MGQILFRQDDFHKEIFMSLTADIGPCPRCGAQPREKKPDRARILNVRTDDALFAALKKAAGHWKIPHSTFARRILRNVVAEDLAKDFGDPPPMRKHRDGATLPQLITARVDCALLARVDEVARRRGLNRSAYVEDVLRSALQRLGYPRVLGVWPDRAMGSEADR
jgi:predicted DNA binding CopG/RHH family protein